MPLQQPRPYLTEQFTISLSPRERGAFKPS
jgi:hypothetical protein